MQFLKDLLMWFLYGGSPAADEAVAEQPSAPEVNREKNDKAQPVLDVVDSILSEGRGGDFLHELKTIRPAGKQFDKDRADLIQEVKRLATRKRS